MRTLANGGVPIGDAPFRTLRRHPEKVSSSYLYLWSKVLADGMRNLRESPIQGRPEHVSTICSVRCNSWEPTLTYRSWEPATIADILGG